MKTLLIYADFDWLEEVRLVEELSYESIRGADSYGFFLIKSGFGIMGTSL